MTKGSHKQIKKAKQKRLKKTKQKRLSERQIKQLPFFKRLKYRHAIRKEKEAKRRLADEATLPKGRVKRFFARLAPKRVWHFFTSWYGWKKILKFCAACFLLGVIALGGLFIYFKQQIKDIDLSSIAVSETVNTYLDRNGVVLWEDTGGDNYWLVVDGEQIATPMRQATVAIEDRNFYNHPGIDIKGLTRAVFSTLTGHGVQGGSTLTQQLIKQIYFNKEASSANRGGIARKIKELILAVELEKMYNKEDIITMYLNQSPYGGRRNGVESAAQTYFGKSAADLDLAESALLASIPNNPAILNPYYSYGNESLIKRQQKTLNVMAELGYITKEEAEEAKKIDILAKVLPESSQYANMLAPHFVLEVKKQLEEEYGISTMREGGYTITTTLDYRAQQIAEAAVDQGKQYLAAMGADDTAMVSVDVETSQVIAMVGSSDFHNKQFGELNATVDSLIEPGSTIKPILDYAPLFMKRDGQNFGPGSVLYDENIDRIYCSGTSGKCTLRNSDGRLHGAVTIRTSLAQSYNIPAVKALYINGIDNSLEIAHALGDKSYCANGSYGLSIGIGSGCGVRLVEHANAYASIARGGAYKDLAYVLEIKNRSGEVLDSWSDTKAEQVVDPEVAYMISDILGDTKVRLNIGYKVPGFWSAMKTGTTTNTNNSVKDALMASYTPAVATIAWNGNHDGSIIKSNKKTVVATILNTYMTRVHNEVYGPDGRWSASDKPVKPAGIKTLAVAGKSDIWPSWFDPKKNSGVETTTLEFNKLNHLLAAECTAKSLRVSIEVKKSIDPVTKKETWTVPEPYNRDIIDDCSLNGYDEPTASLSSLGNHIYLTVEGSGTLTYTVYVNGTAVEAGSVKGSGVISVKHELADGESVTAKVTDSYGGSASAEL